MTSTIPGRRLLNFGCGATFHPEWVNIDGSPASPDVVTHDLRKRFPFEDASFEAVYGSHVLEHFDPVGGQRLIEECRRVLRPGGTIRIAVPDLETIARLYLESLDGALNGRNEDKARYDWMLLEFYDQVTRTSPGGSMKAFLEKKHDDALARFVDSRLGDEGRPGARASLRRPFAWRAMRHLGRKWTDVRRYVAQGFACLVLGKRGSDAVREGMFRRSGEVHQWMYDRYSVARLLEGLGFSEVRRCKAGESRIPGFSGFGLEVVDGRERKPDSLYMEATKPG